MSYTQAFGCGETDSKVTNPIPASTTKATAQVPVNKYGWIPPLSFKPITGQPRLITDQNAFLAEDLNVARLNHIYGYLWLAEPDETQSGRHRKSGSLSVLDEIRYFSEATPSLCARSRLVDRYMKQDARRIARNRPCGVASNAVATSDAAIRCNARCQCASRVGYQTCYSTSLQQVRIQPRPT